MPNLTFLGLAERVIAEEKRPLSPSEIWKVAVIKRYDSMLRAKQGKTPASTLYSAIFTDARQNPETLFVKVGDRPARYYLKTLARERQPAELEQAASAETPMNKDMQDLLKRIRNDLQTKEIRREEYDKSFLPEELLSSIRLKK
jgi:hypothetical protein